LRQLRLVALYRVFHALHEGLHINRYPLTGDALRRGQADGVAAFLGVGIQSASGVSKAGTKG